LAQAFANLKYQHKMPLKRTLLFISFTAEEFTLLGSIYYISSRLFPLQNTIANINFDILNVYGKTRDIVALGSEKSDLQHYFRKACEKESMIISSDPNPKSGSLFRSDTYSFFKEGIPSLYIWTGFDFVGKPKDYYQEVRQEYVKRAYHKVKDEFSPR
jgi:Zn-dependent M28 family amino/carboxypeptidase